MKDIKYVEFKKRNGKIGVVEAMWLEDDSWLLIDTYMDLDRGFDLGFGFKRIGRENIVGCFDSFEEVVKFLKLFCGDCEVIWV